MAKKKTARKKINQLSIKECEAIIARLNKDRESLYYNHVLNHYRSLLPDMRSAVELGKITPPAGESAVNITK